jgi:hypothetical protein
VPDDQHDEHPDNRSHYEQPRVPTSMVELPAKTRQWLADKRESDLMMLDKMIEMQRTAQSLGRISKWLFFTMVALIIMLGELGQAFSRLVNFITGGKIGGG